ncbi:MAG: hypothetical protein HZB55_07335 [Deltaproteobacteria bacterium]|nr:hypothetical protein [Deltaproteobacteria bacterium]
MGSFERLRDRLPSLWRPDDDVAGQWLPLRRLDLAALNGSPPWPGTVADGDNTVVVTLPAPLLVRTVGLAPAAARHPIAVLELYRFEGGRPAALPSAVARVERGTARLAAEFREARFALRLKRPGLLSLLLRAAADAFDEADEEAGLVLRSHWFRYADGGVTSPWLRRARTLAGPPTPPVPVAADEDVLEFPYVADLARQGSLLGLLPWRDPLSQREAVEPYRLRIARIVALYREGLGTLGALRNMTEALLSKDRDLPEADQERPFAVEEFTPLGGRVAPGTTRGAPDGLLGPLMRWSVTSEGFDPEPGTLYVEGVAPVAGVTEATAGPLVELFSAGTQRVRRGLAYEGTLAPGQALRVRPAFGSWLGGAEGLRRARSVPGPSAVADPAAPGPWDAVAAPGAPTGTVTALLATRDGALWAADVAAGASRLHRFDGRAWTEALAGLPEVHALAQDGDTLWLATAGGLARLALYPSAGALTSVPAPADLVGAAVHALLRDAGGRWWAGTATGLARLQASGALEPAGVGGDAATSTAVYALHEDASGTLFLGAERGLFRYQPGSGAWHWYEGRDHSDQFPDWKPFFPEKSGTERGFPAEAEVFLPPVRSVRRGRDGTIWVGTDRGIARYVARSVGGLTYTTLLEAFPHVTSSRVHAVAEDERGLLWFATDDGVVRYDGRDWWRERDGALRRVPALPRGPGAGVSHWRFGRAAGAWEVFADRRAGAGDWQPPPAAAPLPVGVATRALGWTDEAIADLGTWDAAAGIFAPSGAAAAGLRSRYKPAEDRVVDGGIPALPRVARGASVWRYLSLEGGAAPRPGPAWTREGRFLPLPVTKEPALEGRHGNADHPLSHFDDDAAFAYLPAARVWLAWEPRGPLAVTVRLGRRVPGETVDAAILDRVWQGLQQVRPAGVRVSLAVGEDLVRKP